MKWMETQGVDLQSKLCLRLGTQELRDKVFEEVVMLHLLRILTGRMFRPRSLDALEGLDIVENTVLGWCTTPKAFK